MRLLYGYATTRHFYAYAYGYPKIDPAIKPSCKVCVSQCPTIDLAINVDQAHNSN